MPDPFGEREQLNAALEAAARMARDYLEGIGDERVLSPEVEVAIGRWSDPMPEEGVGALTALTELAERAREAATRSSGPRFFHFVMGGGTPAAVGADWLTSAYDQPAYAWAASPFAARLEQVAVDWLRQLFELPAEFGGVLTTGATMANFVALAAARNWWGERQGVDVEQEGVGRLPPARDPVERLSASERCPGGGHARLWSGQHSTAREGRGRPDGPRGARARAETGYCAGDRDRQRR